MTQNVSRRSFLVGAGLLGSAMAATMAGCAPKTAAEAAKQSAGDSTAAPDPITDIKETKEADLVIVGLGVAGVSAARSAAENGLKVIAIERCQEPSARSSQFAAFNTDNARMMGIEDVDTTELVNEMMIQCGHRAERMGFTADGVLGLCKQFAHGMVSPS